MSDDEKPTGEALFRKLMEEHVLSGKEPAISVEKSNVIAAIEDDDHPHGVRVQLCRHGHQHRGGAPSGSRHP